LRTPELNSNSFLPARSSRLLLHFAIRTPEARGPFALPADSREFEFRPEFLRIILDRSRPKNHSRQLKLIF